MSDKNNWKAGQKALIEVEVVRADVRILCEVPNAGRNWIAADNLIPLEEADEERPKPRRESEFREDWIVRFPRRKLREFSRLFNTYKDAYDHAMGSNEHDWEIYSLYSKPQEPDPTALKEAADNCTNQALLDEAAEILKGGEG